MSRNGRQGGATLPPTVWVKGRLGWDASLNRPFGVIIVIFQDDLESLAPGCPPFWICPDKVLTLRNHWLNSFFGFVQNYFGYSPFSSYFIFKNRAIEIHVSSPQGGHIPEFNLLVILGPTASGKTRVGVEIARALGGEIISADSRQVYRGMDLGTGKDLKEYGEISYHLIDIVDPGREFSVFEFQERFAETFQDILARKKTSHHGRRDRFIPRGRSEGIPDGQRCLGTRTSGKSLVPALYPNWLPV